MILELACQMVKGYFVQMLLYEHTYQTAVAFLAFKMRGYVGANVNVGAKTYARSSISVVNLHDLWSNYPYSI